MPVFTRRLLHPLSGVLLLALVAGGCRTYGDYGTEAATLNQILQINGQFAEAHQRAQADAAQLQRAAAANPALKPYADAYAAILEVHQAVLEEHSRVADEAAEHRDDYRLLRRAYSAIISDQQIIRDRYAEILTGIQRDVAGMALAPVPVEGRYQVAPQFYQRIAYNVERLPLADILARVQPGAAGPAAGQPPEGQTPEAPTDDAQAPAVGN